MAAIKAGLIQYTELRIIVMKLSEYVCNGSQTTYAHCFLAKLGL